jgi:hypothetical protein
MASRYPERAGSVTDSIAHAEALEFADHRVRFGVDLYDWVAAFLASHTYPPPTTTSPTVSIVATTAPVLPYPLNGAVALIEHPNCPFSGSKERGR